MRRATVNKARSTIDRMVLPPSAWKRVPGGPDEELEEGLRQWLACGIHAADAKHEIALPSAEIDELWCGFILSTARYGRFSRTAYAAFMHRRSRRETARAPDGSIVQVASTAVLGRGITQLPEPGDLATALEWTDLAWKAVARPGEARLF